MALRPGYLAIPLILLVSLVVGFGVHRIARSYEEERGRSRFEGYFHDRAAELTQELAVIREVLHATRSFFEGSEEVTRQEFEIFTRPMLHRHADIRALEWAPRIRAEEREEHVRRGRRIWGDGYRVRRATDHGATGPPSGLKLHSPVLFVEPLEPNRAALGLDLRSEGRRRRALERAEDTGDLSLTEPIELVQAADSRTGFLALLSVRQTDRDGRTSLTGHVVLVFQVRGLLRAALAREASNAGPDLMFYHLFDEEEGGRLTTIDGSIGCDGEGHDGESRSSHRISIGGRLWLLIGEPTAAFLDAHRTKQPAVLGVTAACLWLFLGAATFAVTRSVRLAALRRQDRIFRSVYHGLTEGVVIADLSAGSLLLNEAAERILGPASMSVPVQDWSRVYGLYRPEGEELFPAEELPLALAIRGEPVRRVEVLVRNDLVPDGVLLSVTGATLRDEQAQIQGGVVVFRDITEQKRSEAEVRRLSSAVEQTADSVLITDRSGNIVYVNSAFSEITGYARDEVMGRNPRILTSGVHDDSYFGQLWSNIKRGRTFRDTTTNRRKDGSLYHVEQTITPMRDEQGRVNYYVSVCKDMTDRRKLQEQEIEMRLAASLQQRLYPKAAPRIPGFDIAASVISAELTCGDYYDFIALPDDRLGIVIGDASGHGLSAAFVMAKTRAYLRSLAEGTGDLREILKVVNRFLSTDLEDDRFVSLLLASVDISTRKLVYANAGHAPALVVGEDGALRAELTGTGMALGIGDASTYRMGIEVDLRPGDVVTFFTDGVTESRAEDGRLFDTEGVLDVVRQHRRESALEIVGHLSLAIREFRNGQPGEDDASIVVCRLDS